MPRASKEDAARHRQEIIAAAAHLFRERGIDGVSVPELMEAVGLTHGGFYRHFASKDELVALALDAAFEQSEQYSTEILAEQDTAEAARRAYVERYLSPEHRANRGAGCPHAALSGDVGRSDRKSPLRGTYTKNLSDAVTRLIEMTPDKTPGKARQKAISTLASLVGAMVIARASQGDPISDEVLETVKADLLADQPKRRAG